MLKVTTKKFKFLFYLQTSCKKIFTKSLYDVVKVLVIPHELFLEKIDRKKPLC